jgi:hypothetical protein
MMTFCAGCMTLHERSLRVSPQLLQQLLQMSIGPSARGS